MQARESTELVQRIKAIENRLESHPCFQQGWINISIAARFIKISRRALRYQIELSQKQAPNCPFKEGKHWKKVGGRYQIHLEEWKKQASAIEEKDADI